MKDPELDLILLSSIREEDFDKTVNLMVDRDSFGKTYADWTLIHTEQVALAKTQSSKVEVIRIDPVEFADFCKTYRAEKGDEYLRHMYGMYKLVNC